MKRWLALALVSLALLMGACADDAPTFPGTSATPGSSPSPSNGNIGGTVG
jgi:hypothetical protein